MAKFLDSPSIVELAGSDWQILLEPVRFQYCDDPATIWTVPAGKLTDGPSVPMYLRWLINPAKFPLSGYLHDDLRVRWTTGNAATDGMLRDAVIAEGHMKSWQAYLVYLGVRVGTHTGFKSVVPTDVLDQAISEYARRKKVPASRIEFDEKHSELIIV